MPTPLEKGNALEFAVKTVEATILKASPALKENKFLIESKKIITVAGVHHEIDIFVEAPPLHGKRQRWGGEWWECKYCRHRKWKTLGPG